MPITTVGNLYPTLPPVATNFNLNAFNLLDHYTHFTSTSLSDKTLVRVIWRDDVTREALPHDFLLHALVSLAAAHLGNLDPNMRSYYEQKAAMHRNTALRFCIPTLREVTPENCQALFAFSSIIAVSIFALPDASSREAFSPLDNILMFFTLIKGVHTVLQAHLTGSGPVAWESCCRMDAPIGGQE